MAMAEEGGRTSWPLPRMNDTKEYWWLIRVVGGWWFARVVTREVVIKKLYAE